jgi:hypothetical protein
MDCGKRTLVKALVLGIVLSMASSGVCDTIVMRDGRVMEGKVLGRWGSKMLFRQKGSKATQEIESAQIATVIKDTERSTTKLPETQATQGSRTQPASTPVSVRPLFTTPESLQEALFRLRDQRRPTSRPSNPKEKPDWGNLTTLQREERTQAYLNEITAHERETEEFKAWLGGSARDAVICGTTVSWVLQLADVSRDPLGDGFLVSAVSRRGCKITAAVPPTQRQSLLACAKGAPVGIRGHIDRWEFLQASPKANGAEGRMKSGAAVIAEALAEADPGAERGTEQDGEFRFRLANATIWAPTPPDLQQFTGGKGTEGGASKKTRRCVVFVVDTSGSMVGCFDEVIVSVKMTIRTLTEDDTFHVLFFSHDKYEEIDPKGLVKATEENKRRAYKGMDGMQATGFGSSPIPALEVALRAFRNNQDTVRNTLFVVTDGEFDSSGYQFREAGGKVLVGNEAVIAWLRANNKDKSLHVCPIIFGTPPSAATEASMKVLGAENGGRYKYASIRE